MSIILITNYDENIYNITKSQADFIKKTPHYKSKFRDKTKHIQHYKRCVKKHATMGLPEENPPDPANYLRKHTGKPSYTQCKPQKELKLCENFAHREKSSDPKRSGKQSAKFGKTGKNFIIQNIKVMSKMKAKEPEPKLVLDRYGTSKPLKSGLEPVYIKLPKFGRTPKYLLRFIQVKEKEYQMKKDASGVQQPLCRYITRDEREQLLNGLKQNWEELQKQYQGLPILTDTIPKKNRKSKIEADLKQLEKDIVLVERHPYIYVYDDIGGS